MSATPGRTHLARDERCYARLVSFRVWMYVSLFGLIRMHAVEVGIAALVLSSLNDVRSSFSPTSSFETYSSSEDLPLYLYHTISHSSHRSNYECTMTSNGNTAGGLRLCVTGCA